MPPDEPVANAAAWAAKIRRDMGWPEPADASEDGKKSLREIASEQVSESRALRNPSL